MLHWLVSQAGVNVLATILTLSPLSMSLSQQDLMVFVGYSTILSTVEQRNLKLIYCILEEHLCSTTKSSKTTIISILNIIIIISLECLEKATYLKVLKKLIG